MNLLDIIHFDGDLLFVGQNSRIIYKGKLCENNPDNIFMHYGYGYNWENLQEIKLEKGINGYEADIEFIKSDELYFCFRSSNGEWDNNNKENFHVNIKPAQVTKVDYDPYMVNVPKLKKAYLIRRKIKITFYKTISFIAKLISGNFRRTSHE